MDIETLVQWSKAKEVQTKYGPRMLRKATVTEAFWDAWRKSKNELKQAGVGCLRDERTGEWEVVWWQELSVEVQEQRKESVALSKATSAEIDLPCPEGLDYMPFQKAGIRFALGRKGVLFGDEMGLGKTIQAIGVINADETIDSAIIICPLSLKLNWLRECEKWIVRDLSIGIVNGGWPDTDIVILNYEGVKKYKAQIQARTWGVCIVDECFVGDTFVETVNGPTRIKDIHIGDYVASFNSSSNAVEYKKVVFVNRRLAPNKLYKVAGNISTGNHPYYTEESGYVEAKKIKGKTVRALRKVIYDLRSRGKDSSFLLKTLCQYGEFVGKKTEAQDIYKNLSRMRKAVCTNPQSKSILWHALFSAMENANNFAPCTKEPKSLSEESFNWISKSPSRKSRVGQKGITANEKSQSNEKLTNMQKGKGILERPYISSTWREWENYTSATKTLEWIRLERGLVRISHQNSDGKGSIRISSELLQGGYSQSKSEVGNRNRWKDSSIKEVEILGRKENQYFELFRVESVEIYERGNRPEFEHVCPDGYVYNIEVEDNNNYFANGILVHNCHYIKNYQTQRSAYIKGNGKDIEPIKAGKHLRLTGTPIVNRPVELYNIIEDLGGSWGSFFSFAKRYANATHNGFGWDFSGASNLDELQRRLRETIMVRRLKADVLTELPAKVRQVIELEPDKSDQSKAVQAEIEFEQQSEKRLAELRVQVELAKADSEEAYQQAVERLKDASQVDFTEMSRLRHETAISKIPLVVDFVRSLFDDDNEKKVIIAAHHRDVIDKIANGLIDFYPVSLTGGMGEKERQEVVDRFQNEKRTRVFIGSIQAAGVGITLTASSHVIFAELDWVPGNVSQMEDRAHRIGQKEIVLVQHLVLSGSIDARMAMTIVDKQRVIDSALDKDHPERQVPVFEPRESAATKDAKPDMLAKIADKITDEQVALVHSGLRMLAGLDADRASVINEIGFNRLDGRIGHELASLPQLTRRQAALGMKLLKKYHRQLPEEINSVIEETLK